jgi:hypothetical protein
MKNETEVTEKKRDRMEEEINCDKYHCNDEYCMYCDE